MKTVEQLFEKNGLTLTAKRLPKYKFLVNKEVTVTSSDIQNAFEKAVKTIFIEL